MGLPVKLRHLAPRLAAGAVILDAGLSKRDADAETAKQLHGMASGAYPVLEDVEPDEFVDGLSAAEIGLGAALLAPFVPTGLAGVGLTAFAGGLVGLYARTPGMHEPGSPRPTQEGKALLKDVWLLGIGLGFLADALTGDGSD